MKQTTAQLISFALSQDPTATDYERNGILAIINGEKKPSMEIVSRRDFARLARKSVKWVDRFVRDNPNVIVRVKPPSSSRSIGFTWESVNRFLSGRAKEAV